MIRQVERFSTQLQRLSFGDREGSRQRHIQLEHSRTGNALKRHVRPAAEELGISLGGWHDFRHTLSTKLRRSGVHPKVVSDILGHKKVNLAMDVYDRTDVEDFVQPLTVVVNELFPSCSPDGAVAMNQH